MARPNVVLIVADDLGIGDLASFNGGLTRTPHLDRLRQEGVTLSQHYSASPLCAPARAALMTGRYPHRTGVVDTLAVGGLIRLNPQEITVADRLKAQGYATGIFGKWHLGVGFKGCQPHERGFEEAMVFDPSMDYWGYSLNWNGRLENGEGIYLTDKIAEESCSFVRRHAQEPFFLYCAHFAPHQGRYGLQPPPPETGQQFHAPAACVEHYLDRGLSVSHAQIYGMVDRLDEGVGRLLETIDDLGLRENTLVIFVSDNGAQPVNRRPHGDEVLDRYNLGLRGYKGLVYDGGIRVPSIMRWPDGGLNGGTSCHDMSHFVDWLPTILEAAGGSARADGDGASILPVLRGEDVDESATRFWQFSRYLPLPEHNAAVRRGHWKLLRPPVPAINQWSRDDLIMHERLETEPGKFELSEVLACQGILSTIPEAEKSMLFNLAVDPGETKDLAEECPELRADLENQLRGWYEEVEWERRQIYHQKGLRAPGESLFELRAESLP